MMMMDMFRFVRYRAAAAHSPVTSCASWTSRKHAHIIMDNATEANTLAIGSGVVAARNAGMSSGSSWAAATKMSWLCSGNSPLKIVIWAESRYVAAAGENTRPFLMGGVRPSSRHAQMPMDRCKYKAVLGFMRLLYFDTPSKRHLALGATMWSVFSFFALASSKYVGTFFKSLPFLTSFHCFRSGLQLPKCRYRGRQDTAHHLSQV